MAMSLAATIGSLASLMVAVDVARKVRG